MTEINTKNKKWGLFATVIALALPTMLEQLMQTAVQYIDVAMVGSLGTDATTAVGATTTVNWLIGSTVSALGVGFLAFISRAIGANEKTLVKRASAQTVLTVLVSGIVFTVVPLVLSPVVPMLMRVDPALRSDASRYFFILYTPMLFRASSIIFGTALRASGDTKTPMRLGVLVNVINVVLNFLLIYDTRNITLFGYTFRMLGADLGIMGAAIASAVSFAVGGILMAISFFRHPVLSPKGQSIRPDPEILRPCLKIALPNMLQRFATSLGYVAFASMINSLGSVSTAAHTFANTVESAFYVPGFGMQTAAATLAGNTLGAKDKKRMKELISTTLKIEVFLMIISGGLLFAFAPDLMRLFSDDPEVIRLASTVLRMVAVSEPFYGVSIIIEGVMQGVGQTVTPFKFNVIGMWGIRIVGTFIFTQLLDFGLESAWACMIAHNLLIFVLFVIYYKKGKWNPLNN
jgi:putative MATE family efflux protein